MTNLWTNWKTWSICHKNSPNRACGFFQRKSQCYEYLELKREHALFQYGCVNDEVTYWDKDNFIIDYTMTLDRETVCQHFKPDFTRWQIN
jgi:hypothetical protein